MSRSQAGVTLIVGMILLLILTLLGITIAGMVALEGKMAGGYLSYNTAFQVADSGIEIAKARLTGGVSFPSCQDGQGCQGGQGCQDGLCAEDVSIDPFGPWPNSKEYSVGDQKGEYLIQIVQKRYNPRGSFPCLSYRILARSKGEAKVWIESYYVQTC